MERVKHSGGRVYAVADVEQPPVEVEPDPLEVSAYLRGALNAIDAVVYTIDRHFRITMVNEAWDRFALANGGCGITSQRVLGHNLLDYISGSKRHELRAICESIFRGERPKYELEADISGSTEQCICHITITPVRTSDGEIVGATFTSRDITHYKALLSEVTAQQQQLQQTLASLRRREARANILQRTAEALNSSRSLAATLRVIAEAAVSEAGVAAAVVYILVDGERLVPAGSFGIDTGNWISKAFWLESALARRVLQDGHMLIVDDAARLPAYSLPPLKNGRARSVAALPISSPSGIKGVLEVYASQPNAFDDDHVALLQTLADQSASAIRTAQIVERERHQTRLLRLLNRVGEQLASELNEQGVTRFVTEALVEQLGMTFARVWLFDEQSETLVLRSSSGLYTDTGGEYSRIKLGERTVGMIAATRNAVVTNDVPHTPGVGDSDWAIASGIRSFAGYPLVVHERLLGVLAFFSRSRLDPELVRMLEPLVHQVALALERAMLYVAQVAARDEAQQLARLAGSRAAQLAATLAAMTDGVWTCDLNGSMLTVNDAALAMFGYSHETVRIATVDDIGSLFTFNGGEPETRLGLRTALEGQTVRRELVLQPRGAGKRITVALVATPMRDPGGAIMGAVSVVRDVTEQKMMERLRDDFLTMASHELKTPVTAIKGYAQLALTRLQANGDRARLHRALETIDAQAARISHLVEELLDASRIQEGHLDLRPVSFDLVALAQRCIEHVQQGATGHRFVLDAPAALHGYWDELRIEQVLQNLLENAVKYTPTGGVITTTIAVLDTMVHVTVRDTGVGISAEKQLRVFEPWFQAHTDSIGDYGGMGLGLSICKEIVQRHGGRIWVESEESRGSLFGFSLPLVKTES